MTIRALARKLNLSPTAVSLALRGSTRVSPETRVRVLREARTAGYVPNARLSQLMSEIRRAIAPGFHASLAAFSLFPRRCPWEEHNFQHLREVFDGAVECANRHGYRLELFWLNEPGMRPERFRDILKARGINGLYCLGSLQPDTELPAALNPFAIVGHATSVAARMHRVASHFAHDCRQLLDQLMARGYRKPGLVMKASGDRRTDFAYTSTFAGYQERALPTVHIPILRLERWDGELFTRWLKSNRPDVVVVHHESEVLSSIRQALERCRLAVPGDIGLALLDKNPDRQVYAGMVQNNRLMGAEAIEMLIGRLCLGEFGPPAEPKFELVEGCWNEGRTLRPLARRAVLSPR